MRVDIVKTLGGRRVFGKAVRYVDLLEEIERGLPVRAYEIIADLLGLTPEEEDRLLQVSVRTRARWKHRSRLDPATSDRVVRIARIVALAEFVLENSQHALEWLREPSDLLRGRTPLAAIATDMGADEVTNMLQQMEHGVYA
ncbi:MAG: type II RES/Xre toxin-antitoxin system antitoxin [Steroidobacteraceae bacterium]